MQSGYSKTVARMMGEWCRRIFTGSNFLTNHNRPSQDELHPSGSVIGAKEVRIEFHYLDTSVCLYSCCTLPVLLNRNNTNSSPQRSR